MIHKRAVEAMWSMVKMWSKYSTTMYVLGRCQVAGRQGYLIHSKIVKKLQLDAVIC
jgi:hypothetical protein